MQATRAAIAESKAKLAMEVARVVANTAPTANPIHVGLIQSRIQAEAEIAAAQNQRVAIEQVLKQNEEELGRLPAKEQGLGRVLRDAATAQEIYAMLTKRHEEARINEVMQPTDAQVVDLAVEPERPIRPRKALNVAIAAFLGLFCGFGLVFFLEYMNKTIRNAEDVASYLDLPVLGVIPDNDTRISRPERGEGFAAAWDRLQGFFSSGKKKDGGHRHGK